MSSQPEPMTQISSLNQSKQNKYTCICCRIKFESVNLQRSHFKTEWHLYNLKRRVCDLEPIDLESFDTIQANVPDKQCDESSCYSGSFLDDAPRKNSVSECDDDSSDDWEQIDADEFFDEDYTEDEITLLLKRVVDNDTCLFCDKKSSSIKLNLQHMNTAHGFFIPEERYLIDLEGLMEYLGCKVGAGATCLWCNKQFATKQGVRLHMMYKNHCKIMYDQEIALDEFKEFYDYSSQEQFDMKPANQLVVLKRRRERKNSSGGKMKSPLGGGESDHSVATRNNLNNLIGSSSEHRIAKRFNAARAKMILKTAMSDNNNSRHRMRRQNPI